MKSKFALVVPSILLIVACNTSSADRKTDKPKPAEGGKDEKKGWVLFGVPAESEFSYTGETFSTYVREIVYRVTTKDSRCNDYQVYEIRSYKGAETVSFPVDARCDYWLSVAIGRENTQSSSGSNLSFDSVYRTEETVKITAKSFNAEKKAATSLRLQRTEFGSQVDFGTEWINTIPGDDDIGGDDTWGSDDNSGGDDTSGGTDNTGSDDNTGGDDTSGGTDNTGGDDSTGGSEAATYSKDIEPILKASCTVCHRPGGSRSNSDLTSYQSTSSYKEFVVLKVLDGSMPTSGALPQAQQDLFKSWQDGGYKE